MSDSGENVVIQSGDCSLLLWPALGGKIASLRVRDHELLQAPLHPYAPRNSTMGFAEADASGWDECLPSVGQCSIPTAAGTSKIPDHGDLWRVPWQILDTTSDSATLRARCFSLPLQLTRSLILSPISSSPSAGWKLQLLYSLTNLGAFDVPWSWSAHPLFAVLPGDQVRLPDSARSLHVEGSAGKRLGSHGDAVSWPIAQLKGSGPDAFVPLDLSIAQDSSTGIGDKLSAGPLEQGWASLDRPSVGLRLTVRFDPRVTPYLGLWLCYGGWPEEEGPKQVCVALEPATAPVDSLAETGAWSRSLQPGDTVTWFMDLEISPLPETRSN